MQGIRNKIDLFETMLCVNEVDIVCIQEHWLTDQERQFVNIDGYNLIDIYCRSINKKGGVAIFCRKNIEYIVRKIIKINVEVKEKDFEYCGAELILDNYIIKIISVYRSPTGDIKFFFSELEKLLSIVCKNNDKVILCGDLNMDFLSNSENRNNLVDILNAYNIDFNIREPTRVTSDSSSATDYICTNLRNNLSCTVFENGVSDHTGQVLKFEYNQQHNADNFLYTRIFNEHSYNSFLHYLSTESWVEVYNSRNVDEGFEIFSNILKYYFEISFPKKRVKVNHSNNKPWLTLGIINSSQKLKLLHKIMIQNNNEADREYYRKYKRIYKQVIKKAKELQNQKVYLNSVNKSKGAWKVINSTLGKNKTNIIAEIKTDDDTLISNSEQISENFNNYFVNIPQKISEKHQNREHNVAFSLAKNYPTMFLEPVTSCI